MLQECVDRIIVHSDIGHIPHKMFASFTADQSKNWVIYYSLIAMYNMLSSDIFECWRHFVLACRIYVTLCEKKGQLTEKHILQDRRKWLLVHANALFALLRLITTNPSKCLQA